MPERQPAPTVKRLSLSYFNENLVQQLAKTSKGTQYRVDDGDLAKRLTAQLKELNYFSEIHLEIEHLQRSEDRLIEVVEVDKNDQPWGIEFLVPIPVKKEVTYNFNVYDLNGLRKTYTSSITQKNWQFFLLFPIGIYQKFANEHHIIEKTLSADIFTQMKADIDKGLF